MSAGRESRGQSGVVQIDREDEEGGIKLEGVDRGYYSLTFK